EETNPAVVAKLVAAGAAIVSATCATATLEEVYARVLGDAAVIPREPEATEESLPSRGPAAPDDLAAAEIPRSARNDSGTAAAQRGATGLIAERAALEWVRDGLSLRAGLVVALPVPLAIVAGLVAPTGQAALGATAATYLLVVGILPAFSAVGIAAGQFAGERERGVLTPLLASPASNLAIFGGKGLGWVLPPLAYAAVAEVVYVCALAAAFGPGALARLPLALAAVVLLLVPAVTCFAAVLVSLISSRVRTFNAAQQLG